MTIRSISVPALIFLASFAAFGQDAAPSPVFDAASIKPAKSGDMRGSTFAFTPGGGMKVTNGTLKGLIESAYNVRDFQIAVGPGWLDSDRYDLVAETAPSDRIASDISDTRRRLQSLLAERFQLIVRRETKELPVYMLAAGKNGSRLMESRASNGPSSSPSGIQRECGRMTGTNASVADLIVMLSRQLDRPVIDRTGLSGKYDFQFEWVPDTGPCAATADGGSGPSIFTALQERLGLKLDSTKGPVDVILVDRAEKVSEN